MSGYQLVAGAVGTLASLLVVSVVVLVLAQAWLEDQQS